MHCTISRIRVHLAAGRKATTVINTVSEAATVAALQRIVTRSGRCWGCAQVQSIVDTIG